MRDCIIKTEDLIKYAVELGHKVVAITDHESVSNAVKVEKLAKKYPDIKVIRGNEIYLCRNGLNADNFVPKQDRYYHFILLARNARGHEQIREISTRAWQRSYVARRMRRVPTYYQDLIDIIGKEQGNVIGSSACLGGALPTQLLKYRETGDEQLLSKIYTWINQIDAIFGHGNFFFELQPSKSEEQNYVNHTLISLSKELDIPYIITTDSHYLKKDDAKIHKAYLNSQNGDREVDAFYATTYMMSDEELRGYFSGYSEEEIQSAYDSIQKIADSCEDYSIMRPLKIPRLEWKFTEGQIDQKLWISRIPMLEKFWDSDEADQTLADEVVFGLMNKPECLNQKTYDATNECLEMTWVSSKKNNASWASYFLNLQKIVEECWNAGTLVGCGRGSGVGFNILYLLGITQINPLRETTQTFPWRLTRIGSKVSYLW